MAWQSVSVQMPHTLQRVGQAIDTALANAPAALDAATMRLDTATRAYTPSDLATQVGNVYELRQQLHELLRAGGIYSCIHPFIHPIGDKRGDYAYLTPRQAVEALANKLGDTVNPLPEGTLQAVCVLIRGVGYVDFTDQLHAFNAVFPITELQQAERRARALATLETDKLKRPAGALRPEFVKRDPRRHEHGRELDSALGSRLACTESYTHDTAPEAELAALIDKKRAHMNTTTKCWCNLRDAMSGGTIVGMIATGNPAALRRQLLESRPETAGCKLAALPCWIGEPERMKFFTELFGL